MKPVRLHCDCSATSFAGVSGVLLGLFPAYSWAPDIHLKLFEHSSD